MALHIVIHRPDAEPGGAAETAMRTALREAVWEVGDSHWSPGEETLFVATDLSADYLHAHFLTGLRRRGHPAPGMLLVLTVADSAAWSGLPPEGEAWIRGAL